MTEFIIGNAGERGVCAAAILMIFTFHYSFDYNVGWKVMLLFAEV